MSSQPEDHLPLPQRRTFRHGPDAISLVGGALLVVLGWLALTDSIGNAFDSASPWIIGLAVVVAVLVALPALRPKRQIDRGER